MASKITDGRPAADETRPVTFDEAATSARTSRGMVGRSDLVAGAW